MHKLGFKIVTQIIPFIELNHHQNPIYLQLKRFYTSLTSVNFFLLKDNKRYRRHTALNNKQFQKNLYE